MKPMKPRPPGSACEAITRMLEEIALGEGRDPAAGPKLAARFLDVSVSLLHKASDPDQREDIGFRRVALLAEHFGCTAAAEHLALAAGGVFVSLPAPEADEAYHWRFADLGAETAEEFGEYMASLVKAMADGSVSRSEAARIAREIGEVLGPLAALREQLRRRAAGDGRDDR